MNKLELLKTKLEQARKELNDKGYHYDPELYSKGGYNELMKIKPFEIKYQDVIEEIWPDEAWWKVTNYWDIFDAMAFGGFNDETVIDEIVKHVDSAFLDEAFKIEEGLDKELKELEIKYGCKFEEGHTHAEYEDEFGDEYENGELWDFSLEDIKTGAVEPQKGLVYWLIADRDDETRVFETTEFCEDCSESCKSLKEGTSNFGWLRIFPLLVFYTYDEIENQIKNSNDYPNIEQFTTDKGNGDFHVDYDAYYDACDKFEQDYWDKIDTCVLDEDQVEALEDAIYNFNEETQAIADKRYEIDDMGDYYDDLLNLEDIKVSIEPGYYEAAYISVPEKNFSYLRDDKFKEEQLKRFHDFFDKLKKDFGLSHYEVAWGPASNGETGYKKVESLKEEKEYIVSKEVSSRINSSKDLNDFYAYVERNGDEYSYTWPEDDQDKIDKLTDDMNYAPGEFDKENIKRILGEDLKEEKEYLSDKVSKVLDDYGILYGDIVENGDGTVNIVGVDMDEWEEAQSALENELGVSVLVPDYDHEEFDDELIVTESKKKDCHVNTNAGDPIKNAEFFNASMGTSSEGVAVGEELKEEKEQVTEDLKISTDDTEIHVDPLDAVTTVQSNEGTVVVQSNGDVAVHTDDVDISKEGDEVKVEVSSQEGVVASEVAPEVGASAEVVSGELDTPDTAEVPEIASQDVLVSDEVPAEVESSVEVAEESLEENKLNEESVYDLSSRYDARNSFYGKAKVDVKDDGSQILYSYNTPVCVITKDGDVKLLRKGYLGWFSSQTTLRHVKEFLKQNGKEVGTKNELNKMYPTEDAYDYVR